MVGPSIMVTSTQALFLRIIDGPTFDEEVWSEVVLFENQTLVASDKNVYPVQDYFNPYLQATALRAPYQHWQRLRKGW